MYEGVAAARSSRDLRPALIACGILLAVIGGAYLWMAWRVVTTGQHLLAAQDAGERIAAAAAADDRAALAAAADDLVGELGGAHDAASDPTWAVATLVPVRGTDLSAVHTVADALGSVAHTAAPLVTAFRDDAVDDATAAVGALAASAAAASDVLARVDTGPLLAPVAGGVERARSLLDEAVPVLRSAAALAPLSAAVDRDQPTRVLVMLQNNAELRTGGGITGAYLQITAADGAFTLDAQASSGDFTGRSTPIIDLTSTLDALYGDVIGRFPQNASMPTDFAATAALATAWWELRGGDAPDVVVSVDPLVLVAALRVTGPVTLADGSTLTADDAVTRLLVDAYRTLDSDGQTALMQDAAARVFAQMQGGPADPLRWASALAAPIAQGRISAWAADPVSAAALSASPLGGPEARLDAAGAGAFGVWFNDGTGGKMGGYLDVAMAVETAHCRADGRGAVTLSLTMTSTAPADAAHGLPGDVTGRGLFGTAAGDIGTTVAVAAPPGTFLTSVSKEGAAVAVAETVDGGHPTSALRVNLSPGERNVVEFRFVTADAGSTTPVLVHTPLLTEARVTPPAEVSCG